MPPTAPGLAAYPCPPASSGPSSNTRPPYMEIGEDYILGVWTDELDVQYVRMYRINK